MAWLKVVGGTFLFWLAIGLAFFVAGVRIDSIWLTIAWLASVVWILKRHHHKHPDPTGADRTQWERGISD